MRAPIRLPPKRTGILDLMPVEFNAQSKARLAQVNPALAELMLRIEAQHPDAFEITEGIRDPQRQAQMVAEGKSQTLNSRHLTGNAVDIAMIGPDGKPNWTFEDYQPIAATAKATAASLGIPDFVWGGDWKTLRDAVHFQVGGPQQGGSTNNLTVSSKGGTGMGLLNMPAQQPQTFGQRLGQDFKSGELMDRLAVAFNSMRMNQDPNIAGMIENRQARRETAAQRNATAEWLLSRGHDDLAAAMQAGASPQDALAESVRRMQPANPLDAINLQKAQLELERLRNPQASPMDAINLQKAQIELERLKSGIDMDPNVQSSAPLPDQSGVVLTLRDGSVQVRTVGGDVVTGPAAMDFVRQAQERGAEYQRSIYGARREGTLGADIGMGGEAAAAVERGKAIGQVEGAAIAGAPVDVATADETLRLIEGVRQDPGLDIGTGGTSIANIVPGSPGYDFQNRVNQLLSGGFLTAIDQLRGMGALSNAEGQTATRAISRMDTATSKPAFLDALSDYENIVRMGRERAASRVPQPAPTPVVAPAGVTIRYDENGNRMP